MENRINHTMPKLTDAEFKQLSDFIYNGYGIKLPPVKKVMLEGRLHKRLRAHNFTSFAQYIDYVFSSTGQVQELTHMIDAVSTNKTDFFREPMHFDFMSEVLLPEFAENNPGDTLKIWSTASSSGEEIYSISIVVSEFLSNKNLFDFRVLGTDISVDILKKAVLAVYSTDRVAEIPLEIKRKYFLKSIDNSNPTVRVIPQLRNKTHFQWLNLMDDFYNVPKDFDVVFCRNVLIYFDRQTQEKVINKICTRLKPGGYFFLGHSESVSGMQAPLKQVKPTIFKRI